MDILKSLGVDVSFFWMLAIFIFNYVVLTVLIGRPYFMAFLEREAATQGQDESAQHLIEQRLETDKQFSELARSQNEFTKKMYDTAKANFERERAETLLKEKSVVQDEFKSSLRELEQIVAQTTADLSKYRGEISSAMNLKVTEANHV